MKPPARHFAVFKLPFLWLQVESESRRVTRWESAAHGCHTGIELVCWMPYHVRWNSQSYRYYVLHMILEVCMLQNSTRFGMDQKMVANHFKAFSFMGGSRSPRWLVDDPQKSALAIQVNQKKATNGQWNLEEMPWALPKHCNRGLLDLIGLNRVPFVKWIDCYTLCEQGSCKPPRVSFSYTEKNIHRVKRIRCLRENAFRELEEPKGSLHHASNSFIENSDSCEGWKCKRMDLNFHFPSWKSPHGGKLSQFPWKKKTPLFTRSNPPSRNNLGLDFFQSLQWLFDAMKNFGATKSYLNLQGELMGNFQIHFLFDQ